MKIGPEGMHIRRRKFEQFFATTVTRRPLPFASNTTPNYAMASSERRCRARQSVPYRAGLRKWHAISMCVYASVHRSISIDPCAIFGLFVNYADHFRPSLILLLCRRRRRLNVI